MERLLSARLSPRRPWRARPGASLRLAYRAGQTTLASARQWCGSKGAYNRPRYPRHYCTYRGGLLRQGAEDKAKANDQRHAGERQHHHLKVRKAVVGKQRKIVHDMPPKDVPVISRSEPAEGSWWRPCIFEQTLPLGIDEPPGSTRRVRDRRLAERTRRRRRGAGDGRRRPCAGGPSSHIARPRLLS